MKTCRKCGDVKPETAFKQRKGAPDGLDGRCRECVNTAAKVALLANPDRLARAREATRQWRLEKSAEVQFRVAIRKALRGQKAGRRWETLVGYTLADLTKHLERQMPKGYSLADIGSGRIHIDHIVPKIGYDVTKPEELRAAWCLSNLRPLTAAENHRKGARREFLL